MIKTTNTKTLTITVTDDCGREIKSREFDLAEVGEVAFIDVALKSLSRKRVGGGRMEVDLVPAGESVDDLLGLLQRFGL